MKKLRLREGGYLSKAKHLGMSSLAPEPLVLKVT